MLFPPPLPFRKQPPHPLTSFVFLTGKEFWSNLSGHPAPFVDTIVDDLNGLICIIFVCYLLSNPWRKLTTRPEFLISNDIWFPSVFIKGLYIHNWAASFVCNYLVIYISVARILKRMSQVIVIEINPVLLKFQFCVKLLGFGWRVFKACSIPLIHYAGDFHRLLRRLVFHLLA